MDLDKHNHYRLLVVDDESEGITSIKRILSSHPEIEVIACASGDEAITLVKNNPYRFAVILMDYKLGKMSGAEATAEIIKINPLQIVVINSGDESREAAVDSWRAGAVDYIEKRSDAETIRTKILLCLKKYIESHEVFEGESDTEFKALIQSVGLAGGSAETAQTAKLIQKAAATDAPVLITGESGVGKEEVAKSIHRVSKRSSMNFVAENMTAIPHEIFESTLFGHMKGSFTGAISDKEGLFKKANGGTIFLDEIGDMRLDQQVKLLRVLQSGEFHPVGSNRIEKVNVRIVAATNKNLESAILDKSFRDDLYYRLNIIRIHVPPLRERIEDIRPLIEHFKKSKKYSSKVILMEVVKKFEKYAWPGNVRELYAELTRLFEYFNDEPRITLRHLDSKFFADQILTEKQKALLSFEELKERHKKEEIGLIKAHVKKFRNLRDAATEGLKIPYSTLFSKMKSLKLIEETKG